MNKLIPAPVIAVVADLIALSETHATLDNLFMYAGAPGDPPPSSKPAKALAWLRRINKETSDPLQILGRLIEVYMEALIEPNDSYAQSRKEKISKILTQCELQYIKGGRIGGKLATPSITLEQAIRSKDIASLNEEFERALKNIETSPREAVSAACNLLESVCKVYIEEENLVMPAKQDLQSVWSIVRKDLGFDPSCIQDKDLQTILSGILSVVGGIGALRTHASSAHGAGKKIYKLEPRHARLSVHAAHTIVLFIIESWDKKKLH